MQRWTLRVARSACYVPGNSYPGGQLQRYLTAAPSFSSCRPSLAESQCPPSSSHGHFRQASQPATLGTNILRITWTSFQAATIIIDDTYGCLSAASYDAVAIAHIPPCWPLVRRPFVTTTNSHSPSFNEDVHSLDAFPLPDIARHRTLRAGSRKIGSLTLEADIQHPRQEIRDLRSGAANLRQEPDIEWRYRSNNSVWTQTCHRRISEDD